MVWQRRCLVCSLFYALCEHKLSTACTVYFTRANQHTQKKKPASIHYIALPENEQRYSEPQLLLSPQQYISLYKLYSQDDCDLCLESLGPVLIQPTYSCIYITLYIALSLEISKRHTANETRKKKILATSLAIAKNCFRFAVLCRLIRVYFFCELIFRLQASRPISLVLDGRAARLLHNI